MIRKTIALIVLPLALQAQAPPPAAAEPLPTFTEVRARNRLATGAPVRTNFRYTLHRMTMPDGLSEFDSETWIEAPSRILIRMKMPAGYSESGTDGKVAWTRSSLAGAVLLSDDQAAVLRRQAAVETGFSMDTNYAVIGARTIEGRKVFQVTGGTGDDESIIYVDALTYLVTGVDFPNRAPVGDVPMLRFADYQDFEGTRFATTMIARSPTGPVVTKVLAVSHKPIDQARFAPPLEVVELLQGSKP